MTDILLPDVAGSQSHFVSVGDDRIHYVSIGQGELTLVFIHGWACHLGFWREQVAALADQARLILIDLPGHGQSDKPETNYNMDFFAEAVLAVMRDANVEKAALIGHSMGGAVMCRIQSRAPEKVTAMISVDGLLRRLAGTPAEGQRLIAPFASSRYREHATGFIRSLFPFSGAEKLCEQVTSEMLATPQHVMLGGMLAMLDPRQPDWILRKVDCPVIVLNAPSEWWNAAYEHYVRSLSSQTDYRVMPGASHFLMLEKPAEFNALLIGKLRPFNLIRK